MNTGCELAAQSECRWAGSVIYTHVPIRSGTHSLLCFAWILTEIFTRIRLIPLATGTQGHWHEAERRGQQGHLSRKPSSQYDRQTDSNVDGKCVPLKALLWWCYPLLSEHVSHSNFPNNEPFDFRNSVNSLSIPFLCSELRGTPASGLGRQWTVERWEWKLGSNFVSPDQTSGSLTPGGLLPTNLNTV